jgi:rhodanese-related sulfurtransferase
MESESSLKRIQPEYWGTKAETDLAPRCGRIRVASVAASAAVENLMVSRRFFPAFMTLLCLATTPHPVKSADKPATANPLSPKATAPRDVTPEEAERILKLNPGMVILDVRTPEEFGDGHLPGAVNLNFFATDFLEKVKAYEGKQILIHCASGGRSGQALSRLKDTSFSALYHLKSGFTGWQSAGKKIER